MLTFDKPRHEYRFNGVVLPSVTQILSMLTDMSMIPSEILERKRQIGTAVHAAIEIDLDPELELDADSIDESWAGYFAGWKRFQAESGFVMTANEAYVHSAKFGYCGMLDLVGTLPKTGPALIDTKCVAVLYPSVGPQTSAYAMAYGLPGIKRYALQLTPDGRYNLAPCVSKRDWDVFLAALQIFNWRKIHGIRSN